MDPVTRIEPRRMREGWKSDWWTGQSRPLDGLQPIHPALTCSAHAFVLLLLAIPLRSLLRGLLLLSDDVALGGLSRLRLGREAYQDGKRNETKHDEPNLREDGPMLATDGREHQTK